MLAGLWEFPNVPGKLSVTEAIDAVENMGVRTKDIIRKVEKKHIFTHIEWHMSGIYMDVREQNGEFVWMHRDRIREEAALPTAFRQFWEEIEHV